MSWMRSWSLCELCRRWSSAPLCMPCRERHAAPVPRCGRCALRLDGPSSRCHGCLDDPPPFDAARCAVDYTFPWDGVVADFKFRDRPELATLMASLMLPAPGHDPAMRDVDLIVPVPLSKARLAERGYNQAWELARRLARRAQRPATATLLARRADTAHQTALDRAGRLDNLRDAFVVEPASAVALHGARVALVDDVMTTGATLSQAARTLRQAGAARVEAWVFARTP